METKARIRRRINEMRKALPEAENTAASVNAGLKLAATREFAAAGSVCIYLNLPWEIGTGQIVRESVVREKRLCIPAFDASRNRYGVAEYCEETEMFAGRMKVREPVSPVWVEPAEIDLFVVPGVAFGTGGERIGHGSGHYDRILAAAAEGEPTKIGLGFDFQVMEKIPQESWDQRLDLIVTDKRVVRCLQPAGEGPTKALTENDGATPR
jgi:5-formyltetrahydrofolate cyclo-ligase